VSYHNQSIAQSEEVKDIRSDLAEVKNINSFLMYEIEQYKQQILIHDPEEPLELESSLAQATSSEISRNGTLLNLFVTTKNDERDLSEQLDETKMRSSMQQATINSLKLYIEKILGKIAKKRLEGAVFEDL
jgi:hypothetical protein